MAQLFQNGAYINEIEKRSYPIGVPSKGYDASGKVIPAQSSFMNRNPSATITPPAEKVIVPPHYVNPKTGNLYTATEIAQNIANAIPETAGAEIPKMAGDQFLNREQTTEQLMAEASRVNNLRNDIAVGESDPYGIASKSGISYSPAELKAIEKAYAGIYDPALETAKAKLDAKQKADAAALKAKQDREDMIFQTNEDIRKWKATTGRKGGSDNETFTQSQINSGAINAGLTIDGFKQLDKDLQNFYIQDPKTIDPDTNKSISISSAFMKAIAAVKAGKEKAKDVADEIEASNLPETVKHFYIDQLPLEDVVKEGYFTRLWKAILNK